MDKSSYQQGNSTANHDTSSQLTDKLTHDITEESIDELDKAILRLSVKINASTYELLVLIREFDERVGWLKWGFANCPQWLHWRCDLSLSAAREKIRVAHALKNLPQISAEFGSGLLSYTKVRALTRIATAETEKELLDFARIHTASEVEKRYRRHRNTDSRSTKRANQNFDRRSLTSHRDEERGVMVISVELPLAEGALVMKAIEKAMAADSIDNTPPEISPKENYSVEDGEKPRFWKFWSNAQADALVTISKEYLAGETSSGAVSSADQYQIIVHFDESALRQDQAGESDLPIESVNRLSCDCSVVGIVKDKHGEPLSVGRKSRIVNTAMRRAIWARDKGCRFPGCEHTRFVDAHHIKHWNRGGETSLENMMLLCSSHHRLVHEGGFSIHRDTNRRWYFRRPDGVAIPESGYSSENWLDDAGAEYPSAEGPSRDDCISEPRANYAIAA